MSMQRFFGIRTANNIFGNFIWSTGELKDNKYLPVIPAQEVVDALDGAVVDIAVRYIRLPRPMLKAEALKYVEQLDKFKAWKTEIANEVARLEAARISTDRNRKPISQAGSRDRQLLPVDRRRSIVDQLKQTELVDFNLNITNDIPKAPGLYAFYHRNGECLHAGKSGNLRHRIRVQHFTQGGQGAGSDLIQKVQDHNCADSRAAAKKWISEHCRVKWIVVPDEPLRSQAEEYMLDELKPKWHAQKPGRYEV